MDNPPPSRLGRGLSSMVSEVSAIKAGSAPGGSGFQRTPLTDIRQPQPGRTADEALVESVKKFGVLQPLLVTKTPDGYDLLAGSRRLDAARAAGLSDVPALVIPPDRAGPLDVFLDENLARAELAEPDRIRLRDRWVRETGRDMEQAEERIPEVQWESTSSAPAAGKNPQPWIIAACMLALVSAFLLYLLLNAKPIDRRPVVIPVEMVEAPPPVPIATPAPIIAKPPPPDNAWMDNFRFPGHSRARVEDTLHLTFTEPLLADRRLTPRGGILLNQLAAVTLSTDRELHLRFTAPPAVGALLLDHLLAEGLSPARLLLVPAPDGVITLAITPD